MFVTFRAKLVVICEIFMAEIVTNLYVKFILTFK